MHGLGTLTCASGQVYKGRFQNNHRDGRGKMVYLNGKTICGNSLFVDLYSFLKYLNTCRGYL
jgi:hypothetical protein